MGRPRPGTTRLDPVRYEIFRHRLFHILEEGRLAMKMVSGSPVVVEGGETMCALYASDGTPILTAAGILLHCTGAMDFIRKAIEWFEDDPGINEGDQFYFNDPYIGGQHLPDQMVVKPVFYQGRRIAWTGSMMHTSETGGIEPGGMSPSAKEIFHEGVRIRGLKIVEGGRFRKDVFQTIVQQTRDPHLVGLDIKARIAAVNVCARRYLELAEKFGAPFVAEASRRIIEDSEKMSRARLRELPDGTWRSRLYADTIGNREQPVLVQCTLTKRADAITFDYTGSSPQVDGSVNATLSGCWGDLFVVLASQLFWDVSWNGGMFAPVRLVAPEGSVMNCTFPAATGVTTNSVGCLITAVAHECIAKLLYVAGRLEDVNSSWRGPASTPIFGGINQYGGPCIGVILDAFGAGTGATPTRDGVDTGGNMMNPTSCISDVEILELNLPLLYLARRNGADTQGYGTYCGGMGPEMVYMIYGTQVMHMGLVGLGKKTPPNWGMFGGYPGAPQEAMFVRHSDIREWFAQSRCPRTYDDMKQLQGEHIYPSASTRVSPLSEYDVLLGRIGAGGGYGDPLDRDPDRVVRDVRRHALSRAVAEGIFGVVLDPRTGAPDAAATKARREALRAERLREGRRLR